MATVSIIFPGGELSTSKEYPEADHAFMNDHSADKAPFLIHVISFLFGGGEFNPSAAQDSRRRIIAFFDRHLKARETAG